MKRINTYIASLLLICLLSCHDEWLEVKQNKEQVVPQTLEELQALLDNSNIMNINYPYLGELSTNDFYLEYEWWQRATITGRNAYLWKEEVYEGEIVHDWELNYERIFYANTVLDGLKNIQTSQEKDRVKGRALFYKAWCYYQLAQIFCKPFDVNTSTTDLGLPLRQEADITIPVVRSTVRQTYDHIITDLKAAISLLPDKPLKTTRPGKAAANALLAKTYLLMGNYELALQYTDQALQLNPFLLDFNTIDADGRYVLQDNEEILFYGQITAVFPVVDYPYIFINEDLFNSYRENDLRKKVYFRSEDGSGGFNGSYGGRFFFNGIATDELYLIRAETYARLNKKDLAMDALNTLLEHRYASGTFSPQTATDAEDALQQVLNERRRELIFRSIRWSDLRRLNKDPRFATTMIRELNGESFELPPDHPRYVMAIPDVVIQLSGIQQNER